MPTFEICGIVIPDHVVLARDKDRRGCQLAHHHTGEHLEMLDLPESPTFILWESTICKECDCQEEGVDLDAYCVVYGEVSFEEAMKLMRKAREKKG